MHSLKGKQIRDIKVMFKIESSLNVVNPTCDMLLLNACHKLGLNFAAICT